MADTTRRRKRFFRREKEPKPPKPAKPKRAKEPKPKAPRDPVPAGMPRWMPLALAGFALLVAIAALVRATTVANHTPPSIVNLSGRQNELLGAVRPPLAVCDQKLNKKWIGGVRDQAPHYSRDPFGIVRLDGEALCLNGGDPHNSTESIFNLPPGYRPSRVQYRVVRAEGGAAFADSLVVTIQGQVYPEAAANKVDLGGASFRCGPSGKHGCP